MSKNITFNEQSAKAGAYIRFPEFLLYDLHYSKMEDKAKVLYCHLLKKLEYSIFKTEEHERGEEGSRSYKDSEGDLYIIADNVELADVLKCSITTVIKYKKELAAFDLLFETRVKGQSNRLYLLQPVDIGDKKAYYDNLNKLRAEKKEADRIKNEQQKQKKEQQKKAAARGKKAQPKAKKAQPKKAQPKKQKTTKKAAGTLAAAGNLKYLSYGNLKLLSYGNLKLCRQYNYKSFKYYFKKHKSNINLSIKEKAFDPETENILLKNEDRLTDKTVLEIEKLYKIYSDNLERFNRLLKASLASANTKSKIPAYLKACLINPDAPAQPAAAAGSQPRTEAVPGFVADPIKAAEEAAAAIEAAAADADFERQVAELQAELKRKYKGKEPAAAQI